MPDFLKRIKTYTAHSTTIIFICGFLFDMVMLPDLDEPFARYVGFGYLCAIALLIMFREWLVAQNRATIFEQRTYSVATFFISYCSGSALSFVFVYAMRSAAISVSWPLFLILGLCIITNEFISTHNFRFTLDVGVLLFAILFYTIFNVPLLLKVQNNFSFLVSIAITVVVSLLYIYFLQFTSENAMHEAPRGYSLAIGIPMFVGMLYLLNIIPAVPLSLRDGGIYHSVTRITNGEFSAEKEIDTRTFSKYRTPVYHLTPTDTGIYFFSAVGAPAELSAPISHVWEYYDESTQSWKTSTTVSFTLDGGREDGYRAYSKKDNITEGLWRVTVKVDNTRIVGRMKFWVVKTGDNINIEEVKI